MFTRPILIAVILAAAQLTVLYIEKGYTLGEVVPPNQDFAAFPQRLGPWDGEELSVDERIRDFLETRSGCDRIYRNRIGDTVISHVVWTDDYIKVHFPQQCYRQSGWEETASRDITIETSDGSRFDPAGDGSEEHEVDAERQTQFTAKLLTFEMEQNQIQVLYWFQMGDEMFFDRIQHHTIRRQLCWGKRQWPPLVKVMLQSSGPRSEDHLRDMAGRIYSWMQNDSEQISAPTWKTSDNLGTRKWR